MLMHTCCCTSRRRVRRVQTARRIHHRSGKTRRHCTRSLVSRQCCSSTLRLDCVLPYHCRAMLTLFLQLALLPRAAAMFEATYGCAPVVTVPAFIAAPLHSSMLTNAAAPACRDAGPQAIEALITGRSSHHATFRTLDLSLLAGIEALITGRSSDHATFRTLDPNCKNEESVHGSDSLFALVLSAGICRRCLRALTFARVNNLNLFSAASSINRRAAYAPSTLTPMDTATQRLFL